MKRKREEQTGPIGPVGQGEQKPDLNIPEGVDPAQLSINDALALQKQHNINTEVFITNIAAKMKFNVSRY